MASFYWAQSGDGGRALRKLVTASWLFACPSPGIAQAFFIIILTKRIIFQSFHYIKKSYHFPTNFTQKRNEKRKSFFLCRIVLQPLGGNITAAEQYWNLGKSLPVRQAQLSELSFQHPDINLGSSPVIGTVQTGSCTYRQPLSVQIWLQDWRLSLISLQYSSKSHSVIFWMHVMIYSHFI